MKPIQILLLAAVVARALAGPARAQNVQNGDGIDEAQLMIFDTPLYFAVGGDARSIRRYVGRDYQVVDVQVRGWHLDYQSEDRYIDGISVEIYDVTFSVRVYFKDKHNLRDEDELLLKGRMPFFWKVRYAIFALS